MTTVSRATDDDPNRSMLRIGVLGAARIAPQALLRPARRRDDLVVAAVAARRPGAAEAFAAEHGIPRAYGSYDELLADDEVDVVYNALPPSGHAPWSIAALEAGKHVLCEKPAAMNADEARAMVEASERTGRRLIEAFHDRYHPLFGYALGVRDRGVLGEIRSIEGAFDAVDPFDPASIQHDPATGGGALMDLGCYPVHWLRAFTGEEFEVVSAVGTVNPLGADLSIEAAVRFPSGIEGRVHATMASDHGDRAALVVRGTAGTLEIDNPVLPHNGHSVRLTAGGVGRTLTIGAGETYDYQLDALVAAVVRGESVPTEGDDLVGNMAAIDAIYRVAGWRRG
jgi:predicted dehydrogenase